jgi:hypothetical protein
MPDSRDQMTDDGGRRRIRAFSDYVDHSVVMAGLDPAIDAAPPHPFFCVASFELPSPARGEGAKAGTAPVAGVRRRST